MARERNHQAGGRLGKIDRPRTLPTCEGGYKPFKIGELFDVKTPKKKFNANEIQFGGQYPYVARGVGNNGIRGYVTLDTQYLNEGNTLSFGQDTATIFYQTEPYFTGDKIKILHFKKGILNARLACFLMTSMRKAFVNFSWGSSSFSEEVINNTLIYLPTTATGDIDFAFIESRVRELEEERVRELEAYLKAAGFEDCALSNSEREVLSNLSDNIIRSREFKISELFELQGNPQLNKDSFTFGKDSVYPYFTRTVFNNGILGYVDYLDDEHLVKGNSLAVGMMGMQFFYMEHDFYAGQFTKTAFPKFSCFNETLALWFITWLNKSSRTYKDVLVRDFEKTFYNTVISLPVTADGKIDYTFMETAIRAMEKQCIARLKAAFAREHEAYMQVIS